MHWIFSITWKTKAILNLKSNTWYYWQEYILIFEYNQKEIWSRISKFANSQNTIEHVDCTVYTFALFSHAIQTFGWCAYYECVCTLISLSLHTVLLIYRPRNCRDCLQFGKIVMTHLAFVQYFAVCVCFSLVYQTSKEKGDLVPASRSVPHL